MLLDGIGTAIGALEAELAQARRKQQAKTRPRRAAEIASRQAPTIWGHILRRLPGPLAMVADVITVGTAAFDAGKFAGLW